MNDAFWEYVCSMQGTWHTLAIIDVVFLVLLGFSFLFIEPGSGSFVAAVLGVVVIGTYLVLYALVRVQCQRLGQL